VLLKIKEKKKEKKSGCGLRKKKELRMWEDGGRS